MEILRETLWGGTPYLYERAVRARLEELPLEVRKALEGLLGRKLPDPVVLVAGHYHVEAGDEDLYLVLRGKRNQILGAWDAERFKRAAKAWHWVMEVKAQKKAKRRPAAAKFREQKAGKKAGRAPRQEEPLGTREGQ
jgi:hypothetical protein